MSPYLTARRSLKRKLRAWGTILFLCLLGAVAAVGVRVLIESVGGAKATRHEMVDVPSVSPRHEREPAEYEQQDRLVLEKEK